MRGSVIRRVNDPRAESEKPANLDADLTLLDGLKPVQVIDLFGDFCKQLGFSRTESEELYLQAVQEGRVAEIRALAARQAERGQAALQ
jgi:hypothetical protein